MNAPTTVNDSVPSASTLDALYSKIAWKIMPLLIVCYLFAYLDRVNVGFAKLQMLSDLGMSDAAYGFGAGIFFIGYLIFEVPSNLLMMRIGAKKTLCRIMVLWGLISMCMAFVHTPTQFYIARFLLGLAEAGFYPGIVLYLTFWFPSYRRSKIIAIFYMAIPLSGVLGGPLSGYILNFAGASSSIAAWQWLFIIEGLPSVLLGLSIPFLLCNKPSEAAWLSAEEKRMVGDDLRENEKAKHGIAPKREGVLGTLMDPRVWVMAVLCLCQAVLLYGIGFWLPTLVQAMGASSPLNIGLLSAIPFAFALVVINVVGRSSDKHRERRWHLIVPFLVAASFLCISVWLRGNPVLAMIALVIGVGAGYSVSVIMWSLPTLFLTGIGMAAGVGMINAIGGLGGFFSPWAIGAIKTATHSNTGGMYFIALICVIGALITYRLPKHQVNR
jgi:D-galactonate transporter